jgi:cation transport regulator ChaB
MPYASVAELPANVRSKLKGKKRRQWMHVWNSSYQRHGDESRAFGEAWSTVQKGYTAVDNFNFFLPLSKVERNQDGSCTVSGYASTPARDLDNEIVSLDAVKKALPGYWEWRNIREMHQPSAVGIGTESNVDDRGLFLTARITDPAAAQKCIDQVYKGFSIGGRKLAKNGDTITEIELVEISVVDRPANPECRIEVAKKYKERPGAGGYLVKSSQRPASARALSKMAQAVEILAKDPPLAKDGPPAAHDGFSLPAKPMPTPDHATEAPPVEKGEACKAHGVLDCPECMETSPAAKRDVGQEERESLASQGQALPGGGFPIKNKSDLDNARQAFGRAKDKPATARLIRRRARELGVKLPSGWSKKRAMKFLKAAEQLDLDRIPDSPTDPEPTPGLTQTYSSALPAFLTLSADGWAESRREGRLELGHRLSPGLELGGVPASSPKPQKAANFNLNTTVKELIEMNEDQDSDALTKLLLTLTKAPSPRMKRFQIATANLKKVKSSRKECAASIAEAHKVLKAAYLAKLAKAGKKPPFGAPDDADDDEIGKAMRSLNKAYSDLTAMKTFIKAVGVNMEKAASAGQRGQSVNDPEPGFYQVPPGIKDMSEDEMERLGPGGEGSGSSPPLNILGQQFPGKAATTYTQSEAEALQRAAAAEAKVEILERMPSMPSGGRRPYPFDVSKLGLGDGRDSSSMFKDVNPVSLASDDEETRKSAVGKVIGNMIIGGHGRSVFDPHFHGVAGAR